MPKRVLRVVAAFAMAMATACVGNFLGQIAAIFADVVTRLESSSAFIVVLWLVTGVFATVFTIGVAEQLAGKEHAPLRFVGNVVLAISTLAIATTAGLMLGGWAGRDPYEFSLMFTNPWVVVAFFVGSGAMAAVLRSLDDEPAKPQ